MKRLIALSAAVLVAITASLFVNPVQAGPFETVAAPLESFYGSQSGVPDFKFTKSEFGATTLGAIVHLGADALVATVKGYTVVYNPAKNAVDVYVNGGKGFDGKIIYATSKCQLLSGITALGNPGTDGICLPADTLVGNAGGPAYSHTDPAIARSCTWDPKSDGVGVHSC